MSLGCDLTVQGVQAVIQLSGRFVFDAHRNFKQATDTALTHDGVREVVVDLARVEYLDSSALGMLLMLKERCEAAGRAVALRGAAGVVAKVLEVANFNRLFKLI